MSRLIGIRQETEGRVRQRITWLREMKASTRDDEGTGCMREGKDCAREERMWDTTLCITFALYLCVRVCLFVSLVPRSEGRMREVGNSIVCCSLSL